MAPTSTYGPRPAGLRIDERRLARYLADRSGEHHNLFAYPAQSNFSGVQHSLEWIERAQAQGWDVLLDAAAFVPTNRLDLSRWHPDFVTLSFYKIFGYPTGVGCLLARRPALAKLRRPWFAGGTITVASVQGDRYYPARRRRAFEDGTLNYLTLPAIEIGLHFIDRVGLETIHTRVGALGSWLLGTLGSLRHATGRPRRRSTDHDRGSGAARRSRSTSCIPTAASWISAMSTVSRAGTTSPLRTGCFCNPGAGEVAFAISRETLVGGEFGAGMTLDDYVREIGLPSGGAVRASLGVASNLSDVHRFMRFAGEFVDLTDVPDDLPRESPADEKRGDRHAPGNRRGVPRPASSGTTTLLPAAIRSSFLSAGESPTSGIGISISIVPAS